MGTVRRLAAHERLRQSTSTSRKLSASDGTISFPSHPSKSILVSSPPPPSLLQGCHQVITLLQKHERMQQGTSQPGQPGPSNSSGLSFLLFSSPTKTSQETLMGKLSTEVGSRQ